MNVPFRSLFASPSLCAVVLACGLITTALSGSAATSPFDGPGAVAGGLTILHRVDKAAAVRAGERALQQRIVTIVEKPAPSPTGDGHDYVSYAIYYWPNDKTADGLPFVPRDGHRNTAQIEKGDAPRLRAFIANVQALAVAWHFSGDARYAQRAGEWVHAWMVDPKTRMNPNLSFAQIRLGTNGNRGSAGGIIDGAHVPDLIEAMLLLGLPGTHGGADDAAISAWVNGYYQWLTQSEAGREERQKPNNHGIWYRAQAASLAVFLGRQDEARTLITESLKRLGEQVQPDGSQPLELKRADGFSYSVYNVDAHFTVGLIAERIGMDVWTYQPEHGGTLRQAYEYLLPYVGENRRKWPGNQVRPITGRELDFATAIARRVWPTGAGTN